MIELIATILMFGFGAIGVVQSVIWVVGRISPRWRVLRLKVAASKVPGQWNLDLLDRLLRIHRLFERKRGVSIVMVWGKPGESNSMVGDDMTAQEVLEQVRIALRGVE